MKHFEVVINPFTGNCLISMFEGIQLVQNVQATIDFNQERIWRTVKFFIDEVQYTLDLTYRSELILQVIEGEYELFYHEVECEFVHTEKMFRKKVVYAQKIKANSVKLS